MLGLGLAGVDFGVHAGDPVVVEPAVAPVDADFEAVFAATGCMAFSSLSFSWSMKPHSMKNPSMPAALAERIWYSM